MVNMISKPYLIVFYGPPCSGKTTLSNMLSQDLAYKLIGTDSIRISRLMTKQDLYTQSMVDMVYAMLMDAIEESLSQNTSVIAEGMFITKYNKLRILDYFEKANLKFIYVTASIDILMERLFLRDKPTGDNILHHKIPLSLEKLASFFSLSKKPLHNEIIIDTTTESKEESFARIKKIISVNYSYDFLLENAIREH